MALTTLNTGAISFKKLSGKVHTQQNFAVTEEGITTNVQQSYSTVFANPIVKLPATSSGLTTLYSTNGIVERVKFQIDLIPDTQIAVGKSQGYRLKLPSDYNTFGELYPIFSGGTYLYSALGKLQIVPALYGTLKPDGTTEYDPILYQTDGSTIITKFDSINWYVDTYSGIVFVQDPPAGYDSSASRPGYLEAFLYVGDYIDDLLNVMSSGNTGTTATNVGGGVGVFKNKVGQNLNFKSFIGVNGIAVTGTANNIILSFTGSSGGITGGTNGLTKTGSNLKLGGIITGDTSLLSDTDTTHKFSIGSPTKRLNTIRLGSSGLIEFTGNSQTMSFGATEFRIKTNGSNNVYIGNNINLSGGGAIVSNNYLFGNDIGVTTATGNYAIWNHIHGDGHSIVNLGNAGTSINDCSIFGGEVSKLSITGGTAQLTDAGIFSSVRGLIQPQGATSTQGAIVIGGLYNMVKPYNIEGSGRAFGNIAIAGANNVSDGNGSGAMGYYTQSSGLYSFVHGSVVNIDSTDRGNAILFPGTVQKVLARGKHAINMSANSTGQTSGNGANANFSSIIGGYDHNITSGATNSGIFGGSGISVASGVTNTVHFPKVRIGLGVGGSLATGSTSTDYLVINPATGEIEIRNAPSGSTGNTVINKLNVAVVNSDTTLDGTNHVVLVNTSASTLTIFLPVSPLNGQNYKIKDYSGDALINNITISGNGKNIDGASTALINTDRGALELIYSSTIDEWFTLNFLN